MVVEMLEQMMSQNVAEHRLIIERKLGRFLRKHERVHHLDGNRLNNSVDNLAVCESTGKHFVKYHLKGRDKNGKFIKELETL